jgi:urate oxidase
MAKLGANRYGKSRVRVTRVTRLADKHVLQEWNVRLLLHGDFETSFTEADNSKILPTDTMKNTVYSVAHDSKAATIEEFAAELGDYLLERNAQVTEVSVEIEEKSWERVEVDGAPHATTYKLGGPELATVHASRTQGGKWNLVSGIDGLVILKTTKSAFSGYIVDKLTTLKPATDRIFGTRATVKWEYAKSGVDFASIRERVLHTLLAVFAEHDSMSVQHTIYDMGKAALDVVPEIARIQLTMPNLHCLLVDLKPFGQENPNHIFVPTDEPHGYIEAMIER